MSEKLEVKIGPLRLTPWGVEAEGVAKGDGQETVLYICGQPHHLNPGMNWNESALICGCDERKTREILEHPVTQERMTEAKAMLLEERKGTPRGLLERIARLPLVESSTPTTPTCDQRPTCRVTEIQISAPDVFAASSESYVEAIGAAVIDCAGSILKASLYLCAGFDEKGEAVTNLFIPEVKPDAVSDLDAEAAQAALEEHHAVQETLARMRLDLIEVAKASTQQELSWLESIT